MAQNIKQEIDDLISLMSKSGHTASGKSVKTKVECFINKSYHELLEHLDSCPKALNALDALAGSVNNQRLIRKVWLNKLRIIKKSLGTVQLFGNRNEALIFDPNKPFTAYKILKSFFNKAKSEILISDAYVEEGTLDILSGISKGIKLQLLTNHVYGKFKRELILFKREFVNTEARRFNIHDRFFIIDNECFLIGTSLSSVGRTKPAYLVRVDKDAGGIFKKHFIAIWNQARVIK